MSIGRALQGMGAGFTVPSALALLTTTYPSGPERINALAIFGGTGAIGSIIGFLLSDILGSIIPLEADVLLDRHQVEYPIMPPHIYKPRRLVASCDNIIIVVANLNVMLFYSSLALQDVLHYTALKPALAYIVHGVGIIVLIAYMPQLIQAFRTKILVNSVADAEDEDQGVVGAVYNVSLQLGAPIGVALSNINANSRNSPTAVGVELLPGYHAAFYTEAVLGGIDLLVAILLVPNRDPVVVAEKPESALPEDVETLLAMLSKSKLISDDSIIHKTLFTSLESPYEKPAKTQQ
ncbi:hypothetical protein BGZ47_001325 [Haplosporangium gracile]|nr:hypothetical protein BGZ47_001325 [Haplosporangium gracile]